MQEFSESNACKSQLLDSSKVQIARVHGISDQEPVSDPQLSYCLNAHKDTCCRPEMPAPSQSLPAKSAE